MRCLEKLEALISLKQTVQDFFLFGSLSTFLSVSVAAVSMVRFKIDNLSQKFLIYKAIMRTSRYTKGLKTTDQNIFDKKI